jgi:hypothetical protein
MFRGIVGLRGRFTGKAEMSVKFLALETLLTMP